MKALYTKMDTEFRVGEERFVSLAKWLATLRGGKNDEAKTKESSSSSSSSSLSSSSDQHHHRQQGTPTDFFDNISDK